MVNIINQIITTVKNKLTELQIKFLLSQDNKFFSNLYNEIYETYLSNKNCLLTYNKIDLSNICKNNISSFLLQDNINTKQLQLYSGKEIPSEFCLRAIQLETVCMDNNIEIINCDAFSNCLMLKNIKISQNIKIIHDHAFDNCISLEQLVLPKTIEVIEHYAFKNCINLKTVKFI